MSILDDKYYYRLKNVALELTYMASEVKSSTSTNRSKVFNNDKKREEVRSLLAASRSSIEVLQKLLGENYTSEFRDINDDQ